MFLFKKYSNLKFPKKLHVESRPFTLKIFNISDFQLENSKKKFLKSKFKKINVLKMLTFTHKHLLDTVTMLVGIASLLAIGFGILPEPVKSWKIMSGPGFIIPPIVVYLFYALTLNRLGIDARSPLCGSKRYNDNMAVGDAVGVTLAETQNNTVTTYE